MISVALHLLTRAAAGPDYGVSSADLPALICGALVAVAAATLNLIFSAFSGLCALFIEDTSSLDWLWQKLSFVFGGLTFRLDMYPGPLGSVAALTPFPTPLSGTGPIEVGAQPAIAGHSVLALAVCTLFGVLAAHFACRRALRALEPNGADRA